MSIDARLDPVPPFVMVWCVSDAMASGMTDREVHAVMAGLAESERTKARGFRNIDDRLRFALGRVLLRRCLGEIMAVPAAAVTIAQAPDGKPYAAGTDVTFNLSHSGYVILLAIAKGFDVGVDVEMVRPLPDLDCIVDSFLHPLERAGLADMPTAERNEAFFRLWTRKEAFAKAAGLGLRLPPESFAVSGALNEARLLRLPDDSGLSGRFAETVHGWSLQTLSVPLGYVASVAAARSRFTVCWHEIRLSDLAPVRRLVSLD